MHTTTLTHKDGFGQAFLGSCHEACFFKVFISLHSKPEVLVDVCAAAPYRAPAPGEIGSFQIDTGGWVRSVQVVLEAPEKLLSRLIDKSSAKTRFSLSLLGSPCVTNQAYAVFCGRSFNLPFLCHLKGNRRVRSLPQPCCRACRSGDSPTAAQCPTDR